MDPFDRIRRASGRATPPQPEPADDALRVPELIPEGGTWSGRLFDNPSIGLAPGLTWTFDFQFREVSRDYGESPVSLTVDWVPLPGAAWSAMAGRVAASDTFAEPIECSAYFFEHYRFDAVEVRVLEQEGSRLCAEVKAHGDIDGLGVPDWEVKQWLDFEGISVHLHDTETVEQATARLAEHTEITGLVGEAAAYSFEFTESRG